jgi:hypothetical protein
VFPESASQEKEGWERGFLDRGGASERRALTLAHSQKCQILTIPSLTLILASLNVFEPLILKYIFDGLGNQNGRFRSTITDYAYSPFVSVDNPFHL